MRQITVYHVDAFTDQPFGGNPAGVVPDAGDLTEQEMQRIANELHLPESAFLLPSDRPDADFRVRYFTPQQEIDFCGHATLGSAWLLASERNWAKRTERVVFSTNVGLVPIDWAKGETRLSQVTMTQIGPKVAELAVARQELARMLGLSVDDLDDRYPIRLASTGVWHLMVPVKSRQAIDHARPQLQELSLHNKQHGIGTTHLFTFERGTDYDLYTRDFAPAVGIPEDPVTGAANGALAGYLVLEGLLEQTKRHQLRIAQGDAIHRPGRLNITITPGEEGPIIQVGGSAHVTISGQLRLPAEK
ncbi:PhzF family phenazine biosynthesis protein [Brevibacillus fulvus]|uniref:PhzF family phenazine biosynthesis protein n=1 Tax=Brevibacillus fulvus TaxID=1125967 RepID=A0A938Y070_9BACL|nr:PhzF family phenazine biosynthesis protein [Brevibacillus fulvus]MBM7590069.1 PhzF family phenazine biosynthesis protein [Brevibacillus fulvus]